MVDDESEREGRVGLPCCIPWVQPLLTDARIPPRGVFCRGYMIALWLLLPRPFFVGVFFLFFPGRRVNKLWIFHRLVRAFAAYLYMACVVMLPAWVFFKGVQQVRRLFLP